MKWQEGIPEYEVARDWVLLGSYLFAARSVQSIADRCAFGGLCSGGCEVYLEKFREDSDVIGQTALLLNCASRYVSTHGLVYSQRSICSLPCILSYTGCPLSSVSSACVSMRPVVTCSCS